MRIARQKDTALSECHVSVCTLFFTALRPKPSVPWLAQTVINIQLPECHSRNSLKLMETNSHDQS